MARPVQARNWCFTLNNPENGDYAFFKEFIQCNCGYGIMQFERGESGTKHIQGYIQLTKKNRIGWLKSHLSDRAHFEKAKGTPEQNKAYCSKEQSPAFEGEESPFEFGLFKKEKNSTELHTAIGIFKNRDKRLIECVDEHSEQFVKHYKGLLALRAISLGVRRDFKTEVFWLYGPTGSGKSRAIAEEVPCAYYKMPGNKWWDMYDGENDVVVDDVRRDFCTFSEMLRMLDRYPFMVEYKGGSCWFSARRIFFTSPLPPEQFWEGRTEEDMAQFLRRVDNIYKFPEMLEEFKTRVRGGAPHLVNREVEDVTTSTQNYASNFNVPSSTVPIGDSSFEIED